jgi:hypothetical protein
VEQEHLVKEIQVVMENLVDQDHTQMEAEEAEQMLPVLLVQLQEEELVEQVVQVQLHQ